MSKQERKKIEKRRVMINGNNGNNGNNENKEKYILLWSAKTADENLKLENFNLEIFEDQEKAEEELKNLNKFLSSVTTVDELFSKIIPLNETEEFIKNNRIVLPEQMIQLIKELKELNEPNEDISWIETTTFSSVERSYLSFGVIANTGDYNGYDNIFEYLPDQPIKILEMLVEGTTSSIFKILKIIKDEKRKIKINGKILEWEEIEEILEDLDQTEDDDELLF